MRVGFDARWYNESGVGTYVAELLYALAQINGDFDLFVYEDPRNPVPSLDRERVVCVPVRSSKYSLAGQFELRRLCNVAKIDVFHSPFYYSPLLLSCPLVVTIHDLIPFLFRIAPWAKQLLVRMGYRATGLRADHIITDSLNTARDVQKILKVRPCRITPVHCGSSKTVFHSRLDPSERQYLVQKYGVDPPYVVIASAKNWRTKNLPAAFSAATLGQQKSGVNFQIVVYGPEDGLRAYYARDGAFELNFRYVGYLPASDLGALFRNAEVFIMPSLYEGFGLPILDAMSCGCPVITSNAGSLPEVAGGGAQTFAPSDIRGMGEAVAALMCSRPEHERWKQRAIERAADFSWEITARQTAAVYTMICHNSRNKFSTNNNYELVSGELK